MVTQSQTPEIYIGIALAGRHTGLTPRAIRFYEAAGLISPPERRRGVRCFSWQTIDRLVFIAAARRIGLSLRDISELLRMGDRDGPAAEAAGLRELCLTNLERLDRNREILVETIERLSDELGQARSRHQGRRQERSASQVAVPAPLNGSRLHELFHTTSGETVGS